jgi:hypothetical protein
MIGVRCLEWLSVDPAASACPERTCPQGAGTGLAHHAVLIRSLSAWLRVTLYLPKSASALLSGRLRDRGADLVSLACVLLVHRR